MKPTEATVPAPYDVPMFDEDLAVPVSMPYAGTSGWSGSDTSRERATRADRDGTTADRQRTVVGLLRLAGYAGLTWKEISEATGWHHGTASGALSVLHKDGRILRLSDRRDRCKVYVLPDFAEGRDAEAHGRKARCCPNCGTAL